MKRGISMSIVALLLATLVHADTARLERLIAALDQAPRHGGLLFMLTGEYAKAGEDESALYHLHLAVSTGRDFDVDGGSAASSGALRTVNWTAWIPPVG